MRISIQRISILVPFFERSIVLASRIVCPRVDSVDREQTLDTKNDNGRDFSEISGIAFSSQFTAPSGQPILYGVNDGTDTEGELGIWDSGTGRRLLTLVLPNTSNQDWEDMETGPCKVGDNDGKMTYCIFIADTGDNEARLSQGDKTERSNYKIIRILEPDYRDYNDNDKIPVDSISILTYDYSDQSSPTRYSDCEAIFIDPVGWSPQGDGAIGDLYVVTKWENQDTQQNNRIFKIPTSAWSNLNVLHAPKAINSFSGASSFLSSQWTRASISNDGTLITLGSYDKTYVFLRCPGTSVASAIEADDPCLSFSTIVSGQMETIAWTPDGRRSLEIPEGDNSAMGWANMEYGSDQNSAKCPLLQFIDGVCRDVENGQEFLESLCQEKPTALNGNADFDNTSEQVMSNTLMVSVSFTAALLLLLYLTLL